MMMARRARFALVLVCLALVSAACQIANLEEEQAQAERLPQTSFLYSADQSFIGELHAEQDRVVVSSQEIPEIVRQAVVAIEDQRFYQHQGIDLKALLRAAYIDATSGQIVEGGSTITQQYVKNVYVGGEQTIDRKLKEAALAWQLEKKYTKDQILTRYLNTVYFGEGAYGIQAAARAFFSRDAADLSLAQAALLAGLVSAPSDNNPFRHPNVATRQRNLVLDLMQEQDMIAQRAHRHAAKASLRLLPPPEREQETIAPYFIDYLKDWFLSNPHFGDSREERAKLLFEGGLRITTTLDPQMQQYAVRAVGSVLLYGNDPYGAMTVIDPRTGYVRAMVGGRNYYAKDDKIANLNLATGGSSGRPAGSSFKPFTLVAALENGISPDTVYSAPSQIRIPLDNGTVWEPANAEGSSSGSLTLEQATIGSVNTVLAPEGRAHYSASKAALENLTKTLAREMGPFGVRVNCLSPGLVRTGRAAHVSEERYQRTAEERALRREMLPEDLIGPLVFLCSDDARMVTGHTLVVDGGQIFV